MSRLTRFCQTLNFNGSSTFMLIDSIIFSATFILSLILADHGVLFLFEFSILLLLVTFVGVSLLKLFGFYKIVVTSITGNAIIPVLQSVVISSSLAYICAWIMGVEIRLLESIVFAMSSFLGILGIRFIYRNYFLRGGVSKIDGKRLLVYGAGSAGRQLVNSLNIMSEFLPVAFIDDNVNLIGKLVGGLPVFNSDNASELIKDSRIDMIVLAMPSISLKRRKEIVSDLDRHPVIVRIIPGYDELMTKDMDIADLRDVSIYDLLGRDPVPPQTELLDKTLKQKIVVVTGAGGSIGSELCRKIILRNPKTLVLIDNSEYALYAINEELKSSINDMGLILELVPILGSVQDYPKMKSVINEYSVQTLFHSAAYKHVPLVETNICEGVKNNVFGTLALAQAAAECNIDSFTLISSDKAVRPTNVMGASKRMAEFICLYMMDQGAKTVFSMVRFGNVLGSSGSVIPLFEDQIRKNGPVTITHSEVTRFFMTIPEAAELVIQAAALAKGKEVFLLDMGVPIKILDLAKQMIYLKGKTPFFPDEPMQETPYNHIPILFTGLRPGEKLFEELLVNDASNTTDHPLIRSAVETGPSNAKLELILEEMRRACDVLNDAEIRSLMNEAGCQLSSGES